MPRTTQKDLEQLVKILNRRTGGVHDFEIEYAYGRPRLVVNRGSTDVSPRLSTGELQRWIWAFLEGMEYCKGRGRR